MLGLALAFSSDAKRFMSFARESRSGEGSSSGLKPRWDPGWGLVMEPPGDE